ncbi:DUF4349 domain-containing protein [Oceanobacillus sp. CAU 1775]
MKMKIFLLLISIIMLGACSNQDAGEDFASNDSVVVTEDRGEMSFEDSEEESWSGGNEGTEDADTDSESMTNEDTTISDENRKIIYTADLYIETNDYQKTLKSIQGETAKLGGYVVESSMYNGSTENSRSGMIIVRIPQEDFNRFIQLVESESEKVIEKNIAGQDVTEEFIDLESRLTSKRTVEERLLSFMESAEKTEDLLTISKDLANVQEEIEVIIGRMNYLQNRADYATVTISISEDNITLSTIGDDELNTWEETKKQFKRSINFLVTAFSSIIIFVGGNFPVLFIIGLAGVFIYLATRKKWKRESDINNHTPKK